jgi:hypothetical protein
MAFCAPRPHLRSMVDAVHTTLLVFLPVSSSLSIADRVRIRH